MSNGHWTDGGNDLIVARSFAMLADDISGATKAHSCRHILLAPTGQHDNAAASGACDEALERAASDAVARWQLIARDGGGGARRPRHTSALRKGLRAGRTDQKRDRAPRRN